MAERGSRATAAVMVLVAMVAVALGWAIFRFNCDDAYIAFRYISNHRAGWGFVWNPPPFRPVEGYTSFLWVALLDQVWSRLDIAPPEAANWLSLGFSLGSVGVMSALMWRLRLPAAFEPHRAVWLGLMLLGVVTNRTFLAWTTSGLETAMFSFLLLSWVFAAVTMPQGPGVIAAMSLISAFIALCRPDGLLYAAFTGAAAMASVYSRRGLGPRVFLDFSGLVLLAIPVVHLVWRHETYGYWLPNTYYAKSTGMWPLGGAFYATSFALEYFGWIWLWALIRWMRRGEAWQEGDRVAGVAVAAVVAEVGWYTVVIGGDHFEFRIYHHLIPLAFATFPWLASRASVSPRRAFGLMLTWIILSWPIPWTHWRITQALTTRARTHVMVRFVSPHLPTALAPYGFLWDLTQWYLIEHRACMRHQEHKIFAVYQQSIYPPRDPSWLPDQGEPRTVAPPTDPAILPGFSIGIPGWNMPDTVILDKLGLNDIVVARTPVSSEKFSTMAHDRRPPPGYVDCFRPNTTAARGKRAVAPRTSPLTDDEIRACEARFLKLVTGSSTVGGLR